MIELLPGYALGCLDEEDLLKVTRHLSGCVMCRNELLTYWAAADQLALAAPVHIPPPGLRDKILQRAEPSTLASAAQPVADQSIAPGQVVASPRDPSRSSDGMIDRTRRGLAVSGRGFLDALRSLWAHPVQLALGALALLLVAFLGISNYLLWQRVNNLQARAPRENLQLVQMQGTSNAPQATGYLMVFKDEKYGTLVVEDAPPLKPGTQYQLWLIRDGQRTNGGVFSVTDDGYGTLEVAPGRPLDDFQSFGITIEPQGGSPGPTGKKVLGGKL